MSEIPEGSGDRNSGSREEVETQTYHPAFLIETLLVEIFSYLRKPDLLNARLLSSHFNNRIISYLIRKDPIQISLKIQDTESDTDSELSLSPISKFTSLMENSLIILPTKYDLKDLPASYFRNRDFNRFFAVCGPSVRALRIQVPNSLSQGTLLQIAKDLNHLAPNLVSLHLVNVFSSTPAVSFRTNLTKGPMYPKNNPSQNWAYPNLEEFIYSEEDEPVGPAKETWNQMFVKMPKLKKLGLEYTFVDYRTGRVMDEIVGLHTSGKINQLQELRISGLMQATSKFLTASVNPQSGLSVNKLSLLNVFWSLPGDIDITSDLINSQQKSLIELEIGNALVLRTRSSCERRGHFPLYLTEMKRLQILRINLGYLGIVLNCKDPSVHFPRLHTVVIKEGWPDAVKRMSAEFRPSTTVRQLTVSLKIDPNYTKLQNNVDPQPDVLVCLGKIFPNVKRLELLYPSMRQIEETRVVWPELEHLSLKMRNGVNNNVGDDYPEGIDFKLDTFVEKFPVILEFTRLKSLGIDEEDEDKPGSFNNRLGLLFPITIQ